MRSQRAGPTSPLTREESDLDYTTWVAAHRPRLMRTAYLLCGDPFVAEDLVQTCLTRLYLAWPRVSAMDAPLAYARRALVNAHVDLTRHPWWRRERPAAQTPDPGAVVHDESATVDARDVVVTALLALPEGQRRVVVLRYLCGLTVRETAQELAIAEGTVKSQTFDALRSLAVVLAAVDQAEG